GGWGGGRGGGGFWGVGDGAEEPMNTRLMFVPPEFATSSVSGLFDITMPHGSEPTAIGVVEKPLPVDELCQTLSWLKLMFDTKTLPRAASTVMSPTTPCVGSAYVWP